MSISISPCCVGARYNERAADSGHARCQGRTARRATLARYTRIVPARRGAVRGERVVRAATRHASNGVS